MQYGYKKADVSFIADISKMGTNFYQSQHYKIIHPNLDRYTEHLLLKHVRNGDSIFIKYIRMNNLKGKFTYDYFKLNELEIDTIKGAQGINTSRKISHLVTDRIKNALLDLLTKI